MRKAFDMAFRHVAVFLMSVYAFFRFGARRRVIDRPTPGSLIVCNHSCIWDFSFLLLALFPGAKERFLATSVQYDKSRLTSFVFRHLGIIRKQQGARDVQSVREMMRAAKEGGMVVVYAAGMTSFDGRQAWNALPGAGSLPRLLRGDVYTAVTHGGFISAPRYHGTRRRGRVEIEVKRLYTAAEAAALSPEEIQKGINEALGFNDWDWQEKRMAPFRGIRNVKNVTRTLYMCPACGREGTLSEGKREITCSACGLKVRRDRYGFFTSEKGACPRRMDEWADMEIESLKKQMASGDLCLEAENVTLMQAQAGSASREELDTGSLKLSREGLAFTGRGGTQKSFGLSEFQFLIFDDIDVMQLNTDSASYLFRFSDVRLMTKWFFMHRLMVKGNEA